MSDFPTKLRAEREREAQDESRIEQVLSELADRRLLNDVDPDLHREIAIALIKAAGGMCEMTRPAGANADEWNVFISETLGEGSPYLAVQIAEAIDDASRALPCGHHHSLGARLVESGQIVCEFCDTRGQRNDAEKMEAELRAALAEARNALADMLSGWRYIRQNHGDLRGVGWDRCETAASAVLA